METPSNYLVKAVDGFMKPLLLSAFTFLKAEAVKTGKKMDEMTDDEYLSLIYTYTGSTLVKTNLPSLKDKEKKEVPAEDGKCCYVAVRGKDKGKQCGKAVMSGSKHCKAHNKDKSGAKEEATEPKKESVGVDEVKVVPALSETKKSSSLPPISSPIKNVEAESLMVGALLVEGNKVVFTKDTELTVAPKKLECKDIDFPICEIRGDTLIELTFEQTKADHPYLTREEFTERMRPADWVKASIPAILSVLADKKKIPTSSFDSHKVDAKISMAK